VLVRDEPKIDTSSCHVFVAATRQVRVLTCTCVSLNYLVCTPDLYEACGGRGLTGCCV
jgi:hypothetical protein